MHCLIPHWTNSTVLQEALVQTGFAIIRTSKKEKKKKVEKKKQLKKKEATSDLFSNTNHSTVPLQSFVLLHLSCTSQLWASQCSSEENDRKQDERDG